MILCMLHLRLIHNFKSSPHENKCNCLPTNNIVYTMCTYIHKSPTYKISYSQTQTIDVKCLYFS